MISRSYDSRYGIVRVHFSGEIDFLQDLGDHFLALQEIELGDHIRILLTGDNLVLTNQLTKEFAAKHRENRRKAFERFRTARTAVVTTEPIYSAYAEFIGSIGGNLGDQIKLFSTEEAALGWLAKGTNPWPGST